MIPALEQALPERAKARQIEALDRQPVEGFNYVSPKDNSRGSIALNRRQVESIGATLRDLGMAPNSFNWKPREEGPFPGLRPLQEGDEAIFCGRALDIRDGLRALDELRASVTGKALLIHAQSGAGKSSFLRAGLWRRLRRSAAFTPLAIIRTGKGAVRNPTWGLVAGLYDTLARVKELRDHLPVTRAELSQRVTSDLSALLTAFAEADATDGQARTLLLAIDQAEEMTALAQDDATELAALMQTILSASSPLDVRLVLTVRDDSLDIVRERLIDLGFPAGSLITWRLHRLPRTRLTEVIVEPAAAAARAGWPLDIPQSLIYALAEAAAASSGEGGDALPILAITLQRLVNEHRAPNGQIMLPAVEAQTFLDTAVEAAVAKALATANASEDHLLRLIIPHLATWDPSAGGEGTAKRVVSPSERLFSGERGSLKQLADALVRQRLLVTSRTDAGVVFEVAHEALLRVRPLSQLIFEQRDKFEQQRALLFDAREWAKSGENTSRLVHLGDRLKDAENLIEDKDFGHDLKRPETGVERYLAACATEQQAQIERQMLHEKEKQTRELLTGELSHRNKNILASAIALVSLTADSAPSVHEFEERLIHRLHALSKINDFMKGDGWKGANLDEVIRWVCETTGISAFCTLTLKGSNVFASEASTQLLAFVVFELATIAIRHYPLSWKSGTASVEVQWSISANEIQLHWEARGEPLAAPKSHVFDMSFIEKLPNVRTEFNPACLVFDIAVPL